jgi:hypothetical protein
VIAGHNRAEEARALAGQMTDAKAKATMLDIAAGTKRWPCTRSNAPAVQNLSLEW